MFDKDGEVYEDRKENGRFKDKKILSRFTRGGDPSVASGRVDLGREGRDLRRHLWYVSRECRE